MFLKELICRLINLIRLGRRRQTVRGSQRSASLQECAHLYSHWHLRIICTYTIQKCKLDSVGRTHIASLLSHTESLSSTLAARQRAAERLQAWVSGKVKLKVVLYFFLSVQRLLGKQRLPMRGKDQQRPAEQEGKCLADLNLIFASQRRLILQ